MSMNPFRIRAAHQRASGVCLRAARLTFTIAFSLSASLGSPVETPTVRDLIHANLEDLMDMQVTSVSKKEQSLSRAGAAIYVITQADIRSSGATNIPDLLRMAPGVDVARIDANSWAISIRGFNDRYANKVLVLIDGRSVYSSSFSGVFWDGQDVPLEDIERIEVIRGPGGTVWGANAVNGVINIITKSARTTEGGLITAGAGSQTTEDGLIQYGRAIGSKGAYRVFGRYSGLENFRLPNGAGAWDGGRMLHGGFRSDWELSSRDSLTVQGDIENLKEGETYTGVFSNALPSQGTVNDRIHVNAGNILGRWKHALANGSEMSLQVYDDYSHRVMEGLLDAQNTADFDFQHHITAGSRHDIVWGLGARITDGNFTHGYSTSFMPAERLDHLFSGFVQDELHITNSVSLTLGTKVEHNNYTGVEFEPSGQLVWTPVKDHTIWASAARAIRQPNVLDSGLQVDAAILRIPGVPFGLLRILGNPEKKTQKLNDFEAGYRTRMNKRLSLDLAAFLSFYDDLTSAEAKTPYFTTAPAPGYLVIPLVLENLAGAHNYGGELFLNWNVTNRWRISPGYSLLHMSMTRDPASNDSTIGQTAGESPEQQFQIRSSLTLPHRMEWDSNLFYVGRLSSTGIPGYARLDTRLGWNFGESLELSVVGQNLLGPHLEFPDAHGLNSTLAERSIFGKVAWRF